MLLQVLGVTSVTVVLFYRVTVFECYRCYNVTGVTKEDVDEKKCAVTSTASCD